MNLNTLRHDILAGLVVFLVALPLGLGIAQASGLPPFVGLLTSVVGGIIVTLFSPSRFAVSGPAAGLVTIVSDSIVSLGSFSALLLAIILAGVLQCIFSLMRAGRFITLIPSPVIKGMLSAIGILLIIQQIPLALGSDGENEFKSIFHYSKSGFSASALTVSLVGLMIMWLWTIKAVQKNRIFGWLPGPLVVVLFGGLFTLYGNQLFSGTNDLPHITLPNFGSIEHIMAEMVPPDWQAWKNPKVYLVAITLALVASLETLLSQEALKKIRPQHPEASPDKELRAQGIGNMVSGFLGGLPITAVIVRSSANVNAGARTKLSVLLHGVFLLLSGLFMSGLLNIIPLASLAAVLLYTGYKLAAPQQFLVLWRQGLQQFIPFAVTVIGIIMFGMLSGIGIGIVTQLIFSIYKSHHNAMQLTCHSDHFVLSLKQNLTFLHNLRLQNLLNKIPADSMVIVEHENAGYIDPDVVSLLKNFRENAEKRGITLSQWPV